MGFPRLDGLRAPCRSWCIQSANGCRRYRRTIITNCRFILVPLICLAFWASSNPILGQQVQTEEAGRNVPSTGETFAGNLQNRERLKIDAAITQSLAKAACAIHIHSNSAIPFADFLGLPAGPYRKVYGTKSGTRYFGIVGDDCDYVGNPVAPAIRMIFTHHMDGGLIYVALINAKGDVLALLRETPGSSPRYSTARVADIETIYSDLKTEIQSWSNGLTRMLQNQTEQEQAPPKRNDPN